MKKIILLSIALTIAIVGFGQTVYNFDIANDGERTGETAIYKGISEPVYKTVKGRRYIKVVNSNGLSAKKYIPVQKPGALVAIKLETPAAMQKRVAIKYNLNR